MRHIVVVNDIFFKVSETFVYRQVMALQENNRITLAGTGFQIPLADQSFSTLRLFRFGGYSRKLLKMMGLSAFGERFEKSMMRKRFRKFLQQQKVDIIHAHYGWNGVAFLPIAKESGIPLVVSFHGKDASAALRVSSYKNGLPKLFEYASAIIVCSEHMPGILPKGSWDHKMHLIPYGVHVRDRVQQRASDDVIKILHVGRIVPKKGVPDLIRVFVALEKKIGNMELHIIGDGEELDHCRAIASESASAAIVFHGAQPSDKVLDFMEHAHIFVLNSRTDERGDMEGLPNVLLEAMSAEMAVISTIHAGIPMLITDKVNGLLVPERDQAQLAQALETLIGNGPLRQALGAGARKTVSEKFSWHKMQRDLEQVFKTV